MQSSPSGELEGGFSIMKNYQQTRGWRNNNPLNIIHSKSNWKGMRAQQTDKRFVQFVSMDYGFRAAIKTLQSYYRVAQGAKKAFTIDFIIRRWCPDGSEEAYIKHVSEWSGIAADTVLPDPRKREAVPVISKIVAAMARQECGVPADKVPWEDIKAGYMMA